MLTIELNHLNLTELGKLLKFIYSELPTIGVTQYNTLNQIISEMLNNAGIDDTKAELVNIGMGESMAAYWILSAIQYQQENSY